MFLNTFVNSLIIIKMKNFICQIVSRKMERIFKIRQLPHVTELQIFLIALATVKMLTVLLKNDNRLFMLPKTMHLFHGRFAGCFAQV